MELSSSDSSRYEFGVYSFLEKSPPKLNPPSPSPSPAAFLAGATPALVALDAAAGAFPSTLLRMGSVSSSCSSLYSAPKMASKRPFSSVAAAAAVTLFVADGRATRADGGGAAAAGRWPRRLPAATAGATVVPKPTDAMASFCVPTWCECACEACACARSLHFLWCVLSSRGLQRVRRVEAATNGLSTWLGTWARRHRHRYLMIRNWLLPRSRCHFFCMQNAGF